MGKKVNISKKEIARVKKTAMEVVRLCEQLEASITADNKVKNE